MSPQGAARISNREATQLFRRAFQYVRPFFPRFAAKAVLTSLSLLVSILLAWPVKIIVDHVVLKVPLDQPTTPHPPFIEPLLAPLYGASTLDLLAWMAGIQLGLIVLVGAFGTSAAQRDRVSADLAAGRDTATNTENSANAGWSYAGGLFGLVDFLFTMRLTQALNHYYRSRLYERIQRLPMTSFDDERVGDAIYRVMYDTPSITGLSYQILLTPIVTVVNFAVTVLVLRLTFGAHPEIWWTALAVLPVALLVTAPFTGSIRQRVQQSRTAGSQATATIEEGMSNILAVQSLGGNARERRRFDRDSWRSFTEYRGVVLVVIGILAVVLGGTFLLGGVVFFRVSDLVIGGQLSPGDFALLITYYFQLAGYSGALGRLWIRIQAEAPGLSRVFFLMDLPGEQDPPGSSTLSRIRRSITFEGVGFDYPDGTAALRGIDLEVPVGKVTALVGPAGAGKTTFAYLIPRFVEPTRGRVLADGADLQGATRDSIRSQVSFVFQETVLFDATVEENIRTGSPAASDAEVRRAAEAAGAHEFIRQLPEGYQTRLGRAGGKLSVGQRQRLSIARALVRDASVLILDEPTSALDPDTERQLVATLRDASLHRAVIVIAHRLSTIRQADQIIFLDSGRILESGSHAQLMSHPNGSYRHFVTLQTRGAA